MALWDGNLPTDEERLEVEIKKRGKASMRDLLRWRGYMSKKCLEEMLVNLERHGVITRYYSLTK